MERSWKIITNAAREEKHVQKSDVLGLHGTKLTSICPCSLKESLMYEYLLLWNGPGSLFEEAG